MILEFQNAQSVLLIGNAKRLCDTFVSVRATNKRKSGRFFHVLLTVCLSITLVNDQLDPQFFYFITRLLQSSTCFEQRHAHHQEVKLY